jgi:hypothetical protein
MSSDRSADNNGPSTTRQRRYRDQHGLRSTDIAWHTASLLASLRTQTGMRNDDLLAWATRLLWDVVANRTTESTLIPAEIEPMAPDGVALARVTDSVGPNVPIPLSGSSALDANESVLGDAKAGVDRSGPTSGSAHGTRRSRRARMEQGKIPAVTQAEFWPNSA